MKIKTIWILTVISNIFICSQNQSLLLGEKKIEGFPQVELAYQSMALLGEGAIWNYNSEELYWVDIEGKSLHIYSPKDQSNRTIEMPYRIGTVVPSSIKDMVIVGLEDGIYKINLLTSTIEPFADMSSDLVDRRLNDGKCDANGRLWIGSMHLNQIKHKAKLYAVDRLAEVTEKLDKVTISNGIVWTKDHSTMYYIDTPTSSIKAYDFDLENGTITNERIAVEVPEELGYPDGMTIDTEDMVWVGMWNGNAVIRFNPESGELLEKIEVPAHNVTSCAFGGENLETLYITTATVDMTDEEKSNYPLAGSLFKVKPGVKGVRTNTFKL